MWRVWRVCVCGVCTNEPKDADGPATVGLSPWVVPLMEPHRWGHRALAPVPRVPSHAGMQDDAGASPVTGAAKSRPVSSGAPPLPLAWQTYSGSQAADGLPLETLLAGHRYDAAFQAGYTALHWARDAAGAEWCMASGTLLGNVVPLYLHAWNGLRHGVGAVPTPGQLVGAVEAAILLLLRVCQDVCAVEGVMGDPGKGRTVYDAIHAQVTTWVVRWHPHLPTGPSLAASLRTWMATAGAPAAATTATPASRLPNPAWVKGAGPNVPSSWRLGVVTTAPLHVEFGTVDPSVAGHLADRAGDVSAWRSQCATKFIKVLESHDDVRACLAQLSKFCDKVMEGYS